MRIVRRGSLSFAPLGLVQSPLLSHGLRRGLHSSAASRLELNRRTGLAICGEFRSSLDSARELA